MKKLICTLSAFSLALRFAVAADTTTPPPAQTGDASTPAPPTVETKNKSSFAMDESGHNPFWPVGWRPPNKAVATQTTEHATSDISPSAFLVSSITLDQNPAARFAIINGKVMNEGQVFGLQLGNQTYQLTVKAIQDGQVVLARRDQEIVVPLRRR